MVCSMNKKHHYVYIILVIGILLSLFLIYEHFATVASQLCSFGNSLDCHIVSKSPYANLDGIVYLLVIDFGLNIPSVDIKGINWFFDLITSNAFLGFLTLVLLLIMFYFYRNQKNFIFIRSHRLLLWMKGILIFGVLYGFYLLFVQHFILKYYCIFCLGLDLILVTFLILIWGIKE